MMRLRGSLAPPRVDERAYRLALDIWFKNHKKFNRKKILKIAQDIEYDVKFIEPPSPPAPNFNITHINNPLPSLNPPPQKRDLLD